MKKVSIKLILLTFPILLTLSCNDDKKDGILDNNEFTLSSSELNTLTGNIDTVFINGDGEYTAISKDESIVSAFVVNGKNIVIKPNKTGNTIIIVSDTKENSKGSSKQLTITIKERSEKFYLAERFVLIQLEDETYRTVIEEDCMKHPIMSLGDIIEFNFLSSHSGKCYMYQQEKDIQTFEGDFEWDLFPIKTKITMPEPIDILIILSGNSEYNFSVKPPIIICPYEIEATKSSSIEMGYTLIENLTEKYKEQYPTAGISSILFHQVIYSQSFINK